MSPSPQPAQQGMNGIFVDDHLAEERRAWVSLSLQAANKSLKSILVGWVTIWM